MNRIHVSITVMLSLLLVVMLNLVAACDPVEEQASAPPTALPTITVLPFFITETPRVTATLMPSDTPTPSDTPVPTSTATPITPTPTLTLTPTPPVTGQLVSSINVNVRVGPSYQEQPILSIPPGTVVEIHGASQDEGWALVRFLDEDEERIIEGWIDLTLLDIGDYIPPTIGPTPTPDLDVTPAPFVTGTPDGSQTPGPTPDTIPSDRLSDRNVLAYCRQVNVRPPAINSNQTVSIWWSWFVARPELMQDHLDHGAYEVLLDGRLLENYEDFQTEMRQERDGNWYVYWYVPVGTLAPGRHEVTFRLTWDEAINDGYEDFGPGTENEVDSGNCVFTVSG
ncbi:MAG: SH3 domain-containing protein [Anaerolineales bacterium]